MTINLTEAEIALRLTQASSAPADSRSVYFTHLLKGVPRPAAVLVPLLRTDQTWHLLFTRRTDKLPEHRGQVAFPGGRADPGDTSPAQTALREAEEEIGLPADQVQLLGCLDSFTTVSNYRVTPVVGTIPWPIELKLEIEEVERVFIIPLDWLADPTNHEVRLRTRLIPTSGAEAGDKAKQTVTMPVIYFKPYEGEVLWGVSAEIVDNLVTKLVMK